MLEILAGRFCEDRCWSIGAAAHRLRELKQSLSSLHVATVGAASSTSGPVNPAGMLCQSLPNPAWPASLGCTCEARGLHRRPLRTELDRILGPRLKCPDGQEHNHSGSGHCSKASTASATRAKYFVNYQTPPLWVRKWQATSLGRS